MWPLASTGYISNSTGSSVTNCRFSPIIEAKKMIRQLSALCELKFSGGQVSCPWLRNFPRNLTSRELPFKKMSPCWQPCHFYIHVRSAPPKESWPECKSPPDKRVTLGQSNVIIPLEFMTGGLLHRSVKWPLVFDLAPPPWSSLRGRWALPLRDVGVIGFIFHGVQLLPIRFTKLMLHYWFYNKTYVGIGLKIGLPPI